MVVHTGHFSPEWDCLNGCSLFPRIKTSTKHRGIWAKPHKISICVPERFSLFLSESLSLMTLANVKWRVNGVFFNGIL